MLEQIKEDGIHQQSYLKVIMNIGCSFFFDELQ